LSVSVKLTKFGLLAVSKTGNNRGGVRKTKVRVLKLHCSLNNKTCLIFGKQVLVNKKFIITAA
jgi:hypothetical protein